MGEVPVPDSPEERTDAPEEKPNEEERVTPMEVTVEEALPLEPEEKPAEEDTFVDEHGRVVRKTITVRKRIVRRIIRLMEQGKKLKKKFRFLIAQKREQTRLRSFSVKKKRLPGRKSRSMLLRKQLKHQKRSRLRNQDTLRGFM